MYEPIMVHGSEVSMAFSLLLAAIFGALLGIERSVAGKHAGMRTYALVSLGSCLFVIIGALVSSSFVTGFPSLNPMQFFGSIILGVGFIGSGLSFVHGEKSNPEITTASGLWVVAGIGMACGFGLYMLAAIATVLSAALFSIFLRLENRIRQKYSPPQN
jgi:putative Mg2+ transporter-C (MgtC) family protein